MDHRAARESPLPHHPRTSLPRLLLECALAVIIGCLIAILVHFLFGEEFATRQQARVYAPIAGENYGDGQRDAIRVLLIDDAALAAAGQVWPARYSYSARLLQAVAQYKPKAIFVDIYYGALRDDPSIAALTRSLCAIRQQGVPLFMAAARNGAGQYALRPEIDALAGSCFEKVAIQYTPDDIDRVAWSYALNVPGAGQGGAALPSAALALYQVGRAPLAVDHHPLAVSWGSRAAANGVGWARETQGHAGATDAEHEGAQAGAGTGAHAGADDGAHDGAAASTSSYCRASHGWRELLPPGVRNMMYHDVDQPLCVFHETLRAGDFARTTPESDARLRRDIEGKTILIGLATNDSGDFVLSPLHGRIPGIYLHAMVLDNLLVAGQDYARQMHLGLGRDYAVMIAFLLSSMLVVTLLPKLVLPWLAARFGWQVVDDPVAALARRVSTFGTPIAQFCVLAGFLLYGVLRLCAALAVGCLMVWIGQRFFGLGFLSVISVIFITLIAEWFEVNEKITHYLLPHDPEPPHDPAQKHHPEQTHWRRHQPRGTPHDTAP